MKKTGEKCWFYLKILAECATFEHRTKFIFCSIWNTAPWGCLSPFRRETSLCGLAGGPDQNNRKGVLRNEKQAFGKHPDRVYAVDDAANCRVGGRGRSGARHGADSSGPGGRCDPARGGYQGNRSRSLLTRRFFQNDTHGVYCRTEAPWGHHVRQH